MKLGIGAVPVWIYGFILFQNSCKRLLKRRQMGKSWRSLKARTRTDFLASQIDLTKTSGLLRQNQEGELRKTNTAHFPLCLMASIVMSLQYKEQCQNFPVWIWLFTTSYSGVGTISLAWLTSLAIRDLLEWNVLWELFTFCTSGNDTVPTGEINCA